MTAPLHGYLVIDKPAGWTSHDVVGRLRRLLHERKIGHAGTLDPAATGVLPVAVGDATKTLEFLTDASKTYLAEITFGVETDSYDGDGVVSSTADCSGISQTGLALALDGMLGGQLQIPPMHSAVKIGGQRLYEAARKGQVIERPPRPVTFHELSVVAWSAPVAQVYVDCSKGTYVRSLAFDLGRALGCGAHLSGLIRLRSGPFDLQDAWTIGELTELCELGIDTLHDSWPRVAIHPDAALSHLPAIILDADDARRWQQGGTVPSASAASQAVGDFGTVRAYDSDGTWLGVGVRRPGETAWSPTKVIRTAQSTPAIESERLADDSARDRMRDAR